MLLLKRKKEFLIGNFTAGNLEGCSDEHFSTFVGKIEEKQLVWNGFFKSIYGRNFYVQD